MQTDTLSIIKNYIELEGFKLAFHDFSFGGDKVFSLFIENGNLTPVTIDQLEGLHRYLRTVLFVEGVMDENARIELSSPGLDRPIFTHEDYLRFSGSRIRVSLKEQMSGFKRITGVMSEVKESGFLLKSEDGLTLDIAFDNVKSANLSPIYGGQEKKKF